MSWPMPNPAQWNPNAMAVTPDMNMGSLTPEQWAMMQQQNWQQWSQWQQQYAQWHKQFGDKYAQQMQTFPGMGGIPPPPSTAGPKPPPPPDKPPPPPPPHENNQPLFGNKNQPAPIPPPQRTTNYSSINPAPTNSAQWPTSNEPKQPPIQPSVNSEALKKLAEEERLFDIQFKKWEEEIDKWRKENVNHPDKQAYKEYEQRFEACRAQLMERREQMKQKRSRLMNTAVNPNANVPGSTNSTIATPPTTNNYDTGSNFGSTAYSQQKLPQQTHPNIGATSNQQPEPTPPPHTRSNSNSFNNQDSFDSYKKSDASHSSQKNAPGHSDTSSFLPTSSSSKGIPGLDLVPEPSVPSNKPEVIDITDEQANKKLGPDYSTISEGINSILGDEKIMNILSMVRGDASQNVPVTNNQNNAPQQMYANQQGSNYGMAPNSQYITSSGMQQEQYYNQNTMYGGNNMGPGNMGYNSPGIRPGGSNMRPGAPGVRPGPPNMGPNGPDMRQGPPNMGPNGPDMRQGPPNMGPNGPDMRQGPPNMGPNGPDMRQGPPNMGPNGPDMRQGPPNMGPNGPDMRQGPPNMGPNGPDMWQDPSHMGPNGPDMRQSGPNMRPGPGMQYGMQQGNQHYRFSALNNNLGGLQINQGGAQQPQFNNGPRPLMQTLIQRPSRPLQENVPQQTPNANKFYDEQERPLNENIPPVVHQPPRPKWVEEPMFTPSIVVEYEHKPLRLKARDFIDPVHTFDYNHKSKDEDSKRKAIEKEAEELFVRKPRREREDDDERYSRDLFYRDERRPAREERDDRFRDPVRSDPIRDYKERPRDEIREDYPRERPREDYPWERPREEYPRERAREDYTRERPREDFERRRDERYDDRRRDDRDRMRRDDFRDHRDRERDDFRDYRKREEKDSHRDRDRDVRRSDSRNRSRSRDRDSRKRGISRESEASNSTTASKKPKDSSFMNKHVVMIDDLLEPPGRDMRPAKIVIILRGPPGSGKSYLAKLIRDREAEYGGTARVMSIDDYFMQEGEIEEKDPITGKMVKKPTLKYEYDESSEEIYITSLKRAFKRSLTDGYFSFLIYDAVNDTLKSYADIWNYARQNCFQVYICTMELDPQSCFKRNIHNRSLSDIQTICARFFPTPDHHIQLDPTTLLQNAAIPDVQMEDVQIIEDVEPEVENVFTSKWEKMDDADQLARLDGTSKPLRPSKLSMEDYLQLDEWKPNVAKPGKKTVRWADIEERREQEKMRAIGFVVGQTDWNRMTDPTMGSSALTQTKYIERVKKF